MPPFRTDRIATASLRLLVAFSLTSAALFAQARSASPSPEMRVGDRILLAVEGEKALTDSFTVIAGPSVELPLVGTISLAGVRRDELGPLLTKEIGRFIRNPVVRVNVRSEMRLAVLGEVGKPGFYDLPTEARLSDAIEKASGPTKESKLDKMYVERAGSTLIDAGTIRKALDGSVTLAQLGMQSGDRIIVPAGGAFLRTLGIVSSIIALPISIYYLISLRRR